MAQCHPKFTQKPTARPSKKYKKRSKLPAVSFNIAGRGVDVLSSNEIAKNTAHGTTAPAIQLVSLS